jgi:L-lactate dehydrogenase (cytochrome)
VFDYTDGAAESESSLARCREAFGRAEFVPRVLRDVSTVDTTTTLMGARAALPMVFAPTGFTRMMHHQGEPAVARVASRVGVPYVLSTLGTTSPEDLIRAAPGTDAWFQLYVWRDRGASSELIDRVAAAGYRLLVLTVD